MISFIICLTISPFFGLFIVENSPLKNPRGCKWCGIKLNEVEFNSHTINDHFLDKIIITLGSKGAKHKGVVYPSPDPKETIDVSGAGDTFTASFTLKYLETGDVSESIIFANKMASIVVSKRGVTTP